MATRVATFSTKPWTELALSVAVGSESWICPNLFLSCEGKRVGGVIGEVETAFQAELFALGVPRLTYRSGSL